MSYRSQFFIGTVSGIIVSVVSGLILVWLTSPKTNDQPTKPAVTVISQALAVPARPISSEVRQRANPNPKDQNLETLLDQLTFGFRIVHYDIINETQGLLRDVEVKAPSSDALYQNARAEVVPLRLENMKFDIPPNQKLSLISIQKYRDTDLSVAIGSDYYTPIDLADYAAQISSLKTENDITGSNYLVDKILVKSLIFPLFGLSLILVPFFFSRERKQETASAPVKTEAARLNEDNQPAPPETTSKGKRAVR